MHIHLTAPLLNAVHSFTLMMPSDSSDVSLVGFLARLKDNYFAAFVVTVMVVMSGYALYVVIDRWSFYGKAKKESLQYIPMVTRLLKENKLEEAITQAKRFKHSHIAKVVSAALIEFQTDTQSGLHYDVVEAAKRSIERVTLRTASELKDGLGGLATIGSSAPFVGLFGTVIGIIHAFEGMATSGSGGLGSVAGGISEALYTTAGGLAVAIHAVWCFNSFTNVTDKFAVEMHNSASELVDYFIKHNINKG